MLGNMMGKLQEMQQKAEEIKNRFDTIYVKGEAGNGDVVIVVNANRKVTEIKFKQDLSSYDKEELEDLLIVAFNNALEEAQEVQEIEMKDVAKDMLPPGFGL